MKNGISGHGTVAYKAESTSGPATYNALMCTFVREAPCTLLGVVDADFAVDLKCSSFEDGLLAAGVPGAFAARDDDMVVFGALLMAASLADFAFLLIGTSLNSSMVSS